MSAPNADVKRAGVATSAMAKLCTFSFILACVLPVAFSWHSIRVLIPLIVTNDTLSHVPLIPLVSFFLIYVNRKVVFSEVSFEWRLGAALITPGLAILCMSLTNSWQSTATNQFSLMLFALVLYWLGTFVLFFGAKAFWAARFPLFFLLFTVPIPEPFLSQLILYLQKGSAGAAEVFFRIAGIPHLRQGLEFTLPGVRIRVAEECSGIRSTLALFITTVLACHLFLRATWRKLFLCVFVVPIAIIKNGLRIATLSALAIYVDPGFLHGSLHHYGGIVFFVFALLPTVALLIFFQKRELGTSLQSKVCEQES
ncbi:MAG TPA: exosortase/archaeosortase family protein [Candidatus Acidoferrales bacterium]|nr:exosortase/archaeosortase family protein [Candidatus Acidoferrales bacterium]